MLVRVRKLSQSCTDVIADIVSVWETETSITVGTTFVEGTTEDLLSIAEQIRTDEVLVDHNSDNYALRERSHKNAKDARIRWASRIERAVHHAANNA